MKKDRICKYCGKTFKDIEGKIFSNHVRWCDKNPKDRTDEIKARNEKIKLAWKKKPKITENPDLKSFKVICAKCGKEFEVFEKISKFPEKEKYFCSKSCANSRELSLKVKEKIKASVSKIRSHICPKCGKEFFAKGTNQLVLCETCQFKPITKICNWCKKEYKTSKYYVSKTGCCSGACAKKYSAFLNYKEKFKVLKNDFEKFILKLKIYKQKCRFLFSVYSFPNEFNLDLIKQYGWYKAKNRGNNPNGISRDHMFSVKDGFLNNIDPKIISHPANCQLVFQRKNASKKDKSSISFNELIERIKEWDAKYKL